MEGFVIRSKLIIFLATLIIILFAAILRLHGLNWDSDQHLHPDERFLTMVTLAMKWPKDLSQYLDATTSPLNPHNVGFGFFVYGLFPLTLTKWVAQNMDKLNYNDLTIVGRQLSALFDMGTVVLVFLIASEINTKFKAQNPIQVQSSKSKKNIPRARFGFGILDFICHLDLGFWIFPLAAMFLYSAMVLPIQLSHFFAVDTFLTFFIVLCFYLGCKLLNSPLANQLHRLHIKNFIVIAFSGIAFGLALSSKISAILFLPIIVLVFLTISYLTVHNLKQVKVKIFNFLFIFLILNILFLISTYLTFRLANPYTFANPSILDFSLNHKVVANWKELDSFNDSKGGFPPAVQWITTKPFLFPAKNILFWGLGLPMGILAVAAVIYSIASLLHCFIAFVKEKKFSVLSSKFLVLGLSLLWIAIVIGYEGIQFAKPMRYFYPMYPFLAILSGWFLVKIIGYLTNWSNWAHWKLLFIAQCSLFIVLLIYPFSFLTVYSRPHTRVEASRWIYRNIPSGSTLSGEHWDDYLPLSLPTAIKESYNIVEFPLYGTDTREKWSQMNQRLAQTDYVILSSNRLYGSIMTVPQKYPVTMRYYRMLFDGTLGFEKVAEFTSRPNLPIPGIKLCLTPPFVRYGIVALPSQDCGLSGISFVDDYADESFTVYDHPKVIIFKKIRPLDYFKEILN